MQSLGRGKSNNCSPAHWSDNTKALHLIWSSNHFFLWFNLKRNVTLFKKWSTNLSQVLLRCKSMGCLKIAVAQAAMAKWRYAAPLHTKRQGNPALGHTETSHRPYPSPLISTVHRYCSTSPRANLLLTILEWPLGWMIVWVKQKHLDWLIGGIWDGVGGGGG